MSDPLSMRRGRRRPAVPAPLLVDLPVEDLVARCLRKEEEAWGELLRRYSNLIYSTISRIGLTEGDQEDAYQATVAAIYEELHRLRDRGRLVSWIIGIAYRQGVNRLRKRIRARETSFDEVVPGGGRIDPAVPPAHLLPPEERQRLEEAQQLHEAWGLLPERCRRLLELLFYEDPPLDYDEIARIEEIPIGSIGPTRARCLGKLRKIFEDRGWFG